MSKASILLQNFPEMVARRLGFPPPLIRVNLGGYEVIARKGLLRSEADKDDGWLAALIMDSCVFFDLGCNVGEFSLLAALSRPDRVVVAWDANPAALAQCAENLFLNGISHRARFILGFASSQDDETKEFYTFGTDQAGSRYSGHARTASSRGCVSRVATRTIDRIVSELKLTPDLVKIDIEGAESDALEGAKGLAKGSRPPRFIVELHSPPELPMRENCARVLAWCQASDYSAYYLKEHQRLLSPDPVAHRGRCHVLLLPRNAEYPAYLKKISQNSPIEKGLSAFRSHEPEARTKVGVSS